MLKKLLHWASRGYAAVIKGRNYAYDRGWLPVRKLPLPVISIGNIAACGTGKTPLVHLLASHLSSLASCAIVTRGFKSEQEHSNSRLHLADPRAPAVYGDEPTLLAQKTNIPVFVGKNRFKSGQRAYQENIECILLDDGMQHRKLHRDIEIALVDATDPFCSYRFLPYGLLRDEVRSLKRADLIVAIPVQTTAQYTAICKKLRSITDAPVVGMYKEPEWKDPSIKKVGLFCGIGRPEQFVQTVRDLKLEIVDTLFSLDHEVPSQEQLEAFAQSCKEKGAECLVCTEKDSIKLPLPFSGLLPITAIPIALKVAGGKTKWEKFLKTVEKKVKHHE